MAASIDESVKIPKLNNDNYHAWSVRAKAVMIQKNLWEAINPGYGPETLTDNNKKTNDKALAFLYLIVDDNYIDDIEECTRAKEAWEILEEINSKYGLLHIMQLMRELFMIKKGNEEAMKDYIARVTTLHHRLKKCGYGLEDREVALVMLMGLPESYETMIINLEQQEDTITTKEVKKKMLLEEKRKISREMNSEEQGNSKAFKIGGNCWQPRNKQNYERKNQEETTQKSISKPSIKCFCCGKMGNHVAKNCWYNQDNKPPHLKKKNAEQSSNFKVEGKTEEAKLVHHKVLCVRKENKSAAYVWYLDSGATEHMCPYDFKFTSMEPLNSATKVADGRILQIKGKGTVELQLQDKHGGMCITLTNVLYVPQLEDNLMSIGRLTEKKININFCDNMMYANDGQTNEQIFKAERYERLYRLYEKEIKANKVSNEKYDLLHKRMGHASKKKIDNILKIHNLVLESSDKNCDVCIKGKMKKKPFQKSDRKSEKVLELVHTDIMGPINQVSLGGARYIITFMDDYSRYSEVYFLKTKNEALDKFIEYKNKVEIKTGEKIKCLRSDNGREYINNAFEEYLTRQGIERETTAPYNPQQNGIAERLNQTLLANTRCLLLESGMKKPMWAEALHTANYLRNRTPSSAIGEKTPFELWKKREFDYTKLRIFGCKAWYHNPSEKRTSKFDDRAIECIFIGYPDGTKGYKLWNKNEDKFVISRDVQFSEDIFPLREDNTTTKINDINKVEDYVLISLDHKPENVQEHQQENLPEQDMERPQQTLRRSERTRKEKTTSCCQENQCNLITQTVLNTKDPETLEEALSSDDADKWKEAMKREIQSLEENNTWKLVSKGEYDHVIQSKWVFKRKRNENGEITEHKARLVAKGFQQIPGIEYTEAFSPVARLKSIRTIIAIAANKGWKVYHYDIVGAYLNGDLNEKVLMEQPKMTLQSEKKNNTVCLLQKGLYGLKQGGRQWNEKIDSVLRKNQFIQSKSDPCVYYNKKKTIIAGIHVDDIAMTCGTAEEYEFFGKMLNQQFKCKDLGEAKYFLSMKVHRNEYGEINLDQEQIISDLIKQYGMTDAKEASTVLPVGTKFKRRKTTDKKEPKIKVPYRQLIGSLMYIANATRPDIAFATNYLSQFNECYEEEHWKAAKHILRYLKKTKEAKLTYTKGDMTLEGFCDADWGCDPIDRKSVGGYVFKLGDNTISWTSRKQRSVALSSSEAEFLSMVQATKEIIWLRTFLTELDCIQSEQVPTIHVDNQGAIFMANNKVLSERNKHMEIGQFFIRDEVQTKKVKFQYIPSENNIADLMTKNVPGTN